MSDFGPGDLDFEVPNPDEPLVPDVGEAGLLLQRVREMVAGARPMPLSASVMIARDEVLTLLDDAITKLPEELRRARWMLREREEFLAKVQREGDDILDTARSQAERMVQRTEVVQEARRSARRTVDQAQEQARRLIHEAEDYCDQKLAGFEIVLERTLKTVRAGRDRLTATADPEPEPEELGPGGASVFDQDEGPPEAS
jgi:vacuolar-type H+-ATPase subunit H